MRPWDEAHAWAANLVLGGFDDWRLPYASVSAGAGPIDPIVNCSTVSEAACRDNELGYMYFHNLGGSVGSDKTGTQTALGGQQLIGIPGAVWSATAGPFSLHWDFQFGNGFQLATGALDTEVWGVWAVRPGDVIAIPEPAAALPIAVGFLGLMWAKRSKRRATARRKGA